MSALGFSCGTGLTTCITTAFDWQDPKEDSDAWASRLQLEKVGQVGDPDGTCYDIYEVPEETGWTYLVDLCRRGDYQHILLKTPADLLGLEVYLAPLVQGPQAEAASRLFAALDKAFRVFHGHDTDSDCRLCDPAAWKRRDAQQLRREQEKNG